MRRTLFVLLSLISMFFCFCSINGFAAEQSRVPILTYHNFDPSIPGKMTISTKKFAMQLEWLKKNGYTVIPLADVVAYMENKIPSLPKKPVVITVDDGRITVYKYMYPLVRQYNIPVTLFVYPSAISHASYAMTWDQLRELQKTGLFDIQSHTYWHPDFRYEKRHLTAADYQKLLNVQLAYSKKTLQEKLGKNISTLAWPYGIYNKELEQAAAKAGYQMAFTVDDRKASRADKFMAEPRYVVLENQSMKTFAHWVANN